MDIEYEQKYHQLEKKHWWFVSRRHIIFRLLNKYRQNKNTKILDIGCSGGVLIQDLKNKGYKNITGIDISQEGIDCCKRKNLQNVHTMDAGCTTFKDHTFDLIIASDVLEHIEDDQAALFEWSRLLNANGLLIIFPSGSVAVAKNLKSAAKDDEWKMFPAKLIQQTKTDILPIYFDGKNGFLFHLFASKIKNQTLKYSSYIHETRKKIGKEIIIYSGNIIKYKDIENIRDRSELTAYLKNTTYSLNKYER